MLLKKDLILSWKAVPFLLFFTAAYGMLLYRFGIYYVSLILFPVGFFIIFLASESVNRSNVFFLSLPVKPAMIIAERYCVSLILTAGTAVLLLALAPLFSLLMPASPQQPVNLLNFYEFSPFLSAVLLLYSIIIPSVSAFGFNKGIFFTVVFCFAVIAPLLYVFKDELFSFLYRGRGNPLGAVIFFFGVLFFYVLSVPLSCFLFKNFKQW